MHDSNNSGSTTASGASERSRQTQSTVPTQSSKRTPVISYQQCDDRKCGNELDDMHSSSSRQEERTSIDTYATTDDEFEEEEMEDGIPEYTVPDYHHEVFPSDAIPSTPRDFGELFPSGRRISIRHDDSTLDGNMNLRLDTNVDVRGGKVNMTLYHLRMHDLRSRDFSLRRYCRESGREVCHSIRKYQTPGTARPGLQRSFSSAFATLRNKPDSRPSTSAGLKRSDSGYESLKFIDTEGPRLGSAGYGRARSLLPTNTVGLEFSTYAHVDVKRRGTTTGKRYSFEYWGINYEWKRIVQKVGDSEQVAFYLHCDNGDEAVAHVVPARLSSSQAREEVARGGWIPPCYFRLCDESIIESSADIADVIVASGLMALVDDCIKRKFHSKRTTQLRIPLSRNSSFNINFGYIGPKRLINEAFNRSTREETPLPHRIGE